MRATSQAQPNIALVKYWGKRDAVSNLPAAGSLSLTLDSLWTRMSVKFDESGNADALLVNGEEAPAMLPRVSRCLDDIVGVKRPCAMVSSECNFPIAAGLASSASSFAALVVAASHAFGLESETLEMARSAGRASGSAARSLYAGIVELQLADDAIAVASIAAPRDWPLTVTVAITEKSAKKIGSGPAMNISQQTSPFYKEWISRQAQDLANARAAVESRDFAALAAVTEHNCLKMHSVMWSSRPSLVYWNSATLTCLETVRRLQADGVPAFFTIDAGPQVKIISEPAAAEDVGAALRSTNGVVDVMQSPLGDGARLLGGK
ncbi:MAG: diphosphomevalonate decarboxylase [Woeseia sp.]|nr:diphosphomevalonate decarboxylase [Woeseia sp.]MBT8095809.1 diphosphomevalonate decarboxylase [Woeseia sp.]NNE61741.1 diphosphomevalonate decarboxylase [Woeseia sp.]NNL54154.1 diphosphomevalonate decarboxylase [Woeseia sp.]